MELCEHCHIQPATIHIAQVDEGETTNHHYCEECAEELGIELPITQESDELEIEEEVLTCPTCHTTLHDFEEHHQVGCIHCYQVFNDAIVQRNKQFKGFGIYQGKKYRVAESQAYFTELEHLKQELSEAVKLQKFELASVLRDRIRVLESKGKQ